MEVKENKYTAAARALTGETRLEYELRRKHVWMDRAFVLLCMFLASFACNIYLFVRCLR